MSRSRKLTPLELALLGLIRLRPQSGYDLRKQFATTPIGRFSGSPGAVYPALKRLRTQGLVHASVDSTHPLRPREVFRLSRAGGKALEAWVTRLPTREEVLYAADELMLRFAFMPGLCSRADTVRFLQIMADESDRYANELDLVASELADDRAPHGGLAVQHGAEAFRTRARWARQATRRFQSRSTS